MTYAPPAHPGSMSARRSGTAAGRAMTMAGSGLLILLLIISFGGFGMQISGKDPRNLQQLGDSSFASQVAFGFSYAALILYGLGRRRRYINLVISNWPYFSLTALAIVSSIWAPLPLISLRHSLAFLAAGLAMHGVVARLGARPALKLMVRTIVCVVVLSLLYYFVAPSYAVHQHTDGDQSAHAGQWRGIFEHRTALGRTAALCIAMLVVSGKSVLARWWMVLGAMAIAAVELVGAASGGAFVDLALLTAAAVGLHFLRRAAPQARGRLILVYTAVLIAGALLTPLVIETVLNTLGKDVSLTGRIPIWNAMLGIAMDHPFVGFGYSTGFEYQVSQLVSARTGYGFVPNAQNGYLDAFLNLGALGLALSAAILFRLMRDGLRIAWLGDKADGLHLLPFLLAIFFVELNVVEACMISPNDYMTSMLAFISAVAVQFTVEHPRSRTRRSGVVGSPRRRAIAEPASAGVIRPAPRRAGLPS